MVPEDYLRRYTEPLQTLTSAVPTGNWQALVLKADYYYPPHSELRPGLDTLNRTDLLKILQRILAIEYPQQRLFKSTAQEFLETLRRLKDEQAWRQAEMERLEEILAQQQSDNEQMAAELIERQSELQRLSVAWGRCQSEFAVLSNEAATLRANLADLRASTSWKLTRPLRWLGRMARKIQAHDA